MLVTAGNRKIPTPLPSAGKEGQRSGCMEETNYGDQPAPGPTEQRRNRRQRHQQPATAQLDDDRRPQPQVRRLRPECQHPRQAAAEWQLGDRTSTRCHRCSRPDLAGQLTEQGQSAAFEPLGERPSGGNIPWRLVRVKSRRSSCPPRQSRRLPHSGKQGCPLGLNNLGASTNPPIGG